MRRSRAFFLSFAIAACSSSTTINSSSNTPPAPPPESSSGGDITGTGTGTGDAAADSAPDGSSSGGPTCGLTTGATTGSSDTCIGGNTNEAACPTACGPLFSYTCNAGGSVQPAGLTCITLTPTGESPHVCCAEKQCVRYKPFDSQCASSQAYYCDPSIPLGLNCTRAPANPTDYQCCP